MPTPVQYGVRQPGEPVLRDFQHASRLYRESDLRLAPKTKFLYHVVFNINSNALKNLGFKYRHQNEINMLVKTAELPKFTIQSETLNPTLISFEMISSPTTVAIGVSNTSS